MRAPAAILSVVVLSLAGCPPAKPAPTTGGAAGGAGLDPEACGDISTSDVGRRLHAFLVATAELDRQVTEMEQAVRTSCKTIGAELQMAPADLDGTTKEMCNRVWTTLKADLAAGLRSQQAMVVDYKPGVCTVDVDAAARMAAQCEAQASGTATVTCNGTCTGTCHGACSGTCEGGAAGGQCNGRCNGTCDGSCTGGCTGAADVHASAECKAQAEVHASVTMQCTDPQLTITLKQEDLADAAKANLAATALRKGLPRLLWVAARAKPLAHAVEGWAHAADELGQSAGSLAEQFADRAICVGGQVASALAAVAHIQASISVSVEISVQASGTIGAS
jgi:hypothetical protein